ncbi:MAG: hypothetical protein KAF91_00900 [Nostoc sp. TH1S01]|nr:hypothetical protein [Nostoc sp. TH1S01]
MEPNQHQQRRAANQDFEESLNQLGGILHEENLAENEATQAEEITDADLADELTDIDLAAFEDAVADIEQYLEENAK